MKWENLPESLKTKEVKPYYDILKKRFPARLFKRAFDILSSKLLTSGPVVIQPESIVSFTLFASYSVRSGGEKGIYIQIPPFVKLHLLLCSKSFKNNLLVDSFGGNMILYKK